SVRRTVQRAWASSSPGSRSQKMRWEQSGRVQRNLRTTTRRAMGRSWHGRSATVRQRLRMRSEGDPQTGQAAVAEEETSRAAGVVGVRTKSSRRKPATGKKSGWSTERFQAGETDTDGKGSSSL